MGWTAGADVTTGDLITAAAWNNYMGASGSIQFLFDCPMARVYHDANQTLTQETTTTVAFNSERFDTDTIHDVSSNNSRLTCKTAGVYQISACLQFSAVDGTGNFDSFLRTYFDVNAGTRIAQHKEYVWEGTHVYNVFLTAMYELAVNDYVELKVYAYYLDSNGQIDVAANYSPEFMMHWVGGPTV